MIDGWGPKFSDRVQYFLWTPIHLHNDYDNNNITIIIYSLSSILLFCVNIKYYKVYYRLWVIVWQTVAITHRLGYVLRQNYSMKHARNVITRVTSVKKMVIKSSREKIEFEERNGWTLYNIYIDIEYGTSFHY